MSEKVNDRLPCGHHRDCIANGQETDEAECGWCSEIEYSNNAMAERNKAVREAAEERAARRIQAQELEHIRQAAIVMRRYLAPCDTWSEELAAAVRLYDEAVSTTVPK